MGANGGMAGTMHQRQHQSLHYEQMEHPPVGDEFLDQMFSVSPWSDIGGRSVPWDCGAGGNGTDIGVGSFEALQQKLFLKQESPDTQRAGDGLHFAADDPILLSRLPQQRGLKDLPAKLQKSSSVGSSGSEGSAGQERPRYQSPTPVAPTWRHSYVGGVPPLPMASRQGEGDAVNSEPVLGKRGRDEEDISRDSRSGATAREGPQSSYPTFGGGAQLGQQASLARVVGQQTHQQGNPAAQGVSPAHGHAFGAQGTPPAQNQGTSPDVPAVARPRVRARRGQATDPHSIAERLRRERIAERMKSLQELVPNSNKTDKASMLDEIIDYVKFLQLQVKVLSMSRLGGAGAVAPLVADLPPENPNAFLPATVGRSGGASGPPSEGLALTEKQVARLMEEDMGSAMQYLQSKGLCLMPISLASAISTNGPRGQSVSALGASAQGLINSPTERQRPEQPAVLTRPALSTGGVAVGDRARDGRDAASGEKTNQGLNESSKLPEAGSKPTDDSPRQKLQ